MLATHLHSWLNNDRRFVIYVRRETTPCLLRRPNSRMLATIAICDYITIVNRFSVVSHF